MPKRIAQILGRMDSGGVEAVVMNYYRMLDKDDVQFDFYVDKNSTLPQKQEILSSGGRIFYLPSYSNILKYCLTLGKYFRENDYMIVHSHLSTMSVFALFVAWVEGVPIRIAHSHSTANWYEFKKSLLKYILRPFSKVFATDYFACGEIAGRWLFSNKTFEQGKVFIMENIIDYNKFSFSTENRVALLKEFNIESELVIGHIGRFCEQKNQLYLLDIFQKILENVPTAKLILVGDGDKYKSKVIQKAKELNLLENIIFTGVRNDVERFYSVFDIFLLPSLYEGMPVVAVESMANQLPMIISDKVTSEVDCFSLSIKGSTVQSWCDLAIENARKLY